MNAISLIFLKENHMSKNEIKPFLWAQGVEARVVEPDEGFKERGFCKGDTAVAANFNWIFKTMSGDIASLSKGISEQKKEISSLRTELNALKKESVLEDELQNKLKPIRINVSQALIDSSWGVNEINQIYYGILPHIYECLKSMEKQIQAIHPHYKTQDWPAISPEKMPANDPETE
jgi:hypothetical protein